MTKEVSRLRQRMIDDMKIRNMSPNTQSAYIRAVKNFSLHFGKSPDKLTLEHVREYQLHLVSRGLQAATIIPIMCAIRFFYGTTLGQPNVPEHIPLARKADTLPAVLARDQVVQFLKAVPDLEMRTLFITIYSAGLRVSEAVALTGKEIDSTNMVIHIRQGKGRTSGLAARHASGRRRRNLILVRRSRKCHRDFLRVSNIGNAQMSFDRPSTPLRRGSFDQCRQGFGKPLVLERNTRVTFALVLPRGLFMKALASMSAAALALVVLPLAVSPAAAEYLFYRNSSVLADHREFGVPLSRLDRSDLAHERAREAEHTRIRTRLGDPDRVCRTVVDYASGAMSGPGVVVVVCR
jgi:hypothetical protein